MNNLNWEFFEAYKRLDELCKQILLNDRGISEYIDEMSNEVKDIGLLPTGKMIINN